MAGPTDTPSPSPEDLLATKLVGTDATKPAPAAPDASAALHDSAYTAPPGAPNASRPGAPAPAADVQAGGPAAPPVDAPVVAATPDAKAAVPPAAPGDAPVPAQVKVADAGDTHTKDAPAPQSNALDVMHKVNAILDGDVPAANKAHDLVAAKKAYDQAVALAETLTPQDIAKAQQDLVQVRKDKAAATDPATQRDLANKESDLYTITRLKDAALGNEALWYYRQGKTQDGNEKLLEASGIDPATAQTMKAMGPKETQAFVNFLQNAPSLSPILGDVNFYRQIGKINQAGGQVPDAFTAIHQAILKHNADVAAQPAAPGDAQPAKPGDAPPAKPGDAPAAGPPAAYDFKKNNADMKAFIDLNNQIKDKPGPITADQRATLEAGVKAYDAQNTYIGQVLDASQAALDKLVPPDKQQAFGAAATALNTELGKVTVPVAVTKADGTKGTEQQLPDAIKAKVSAVFNAKTAADYQSSSADLAKTNPDLVKAIQAAAALVPAGPGGVLPAMDVYGQNQELTQEFNATSQQQILAHYSYAKILTGTKTPPDPADLAHAKDVFVGGFNNVPQALAESILAKKEAQDLEKTLGIPVAAPAAPGAPGATAPGAPAAPGAPGDHPGDAPAKPGDAPAATGLAALKDDDLQAQLNAAVKAGPDGFNTAKPLFEEAIRRVELPDIKAQYTAELKAHVTALETGKDADGKPLDAATRLATNARNVDLIDALSAGAQLRKQYAAYLGANHQDKSQDAQQRAAIADADGVDVDLLKRADGQINKDRAANTGDNTNLNDLKARLEGGKDSSGQNNESLLNLRVSLRDNLALLYLKEGLQVNDDKSVTVKTIKSDDVDASFKPQVALQLLTEARAANATINGATAKDSETEQLMVLGQQLSPDTFKSEGQSLKNSGGSLMADAAAFFGSQGGKLLTMSALATLDTVTEGKIKLNPMLAYAAGTGVAIASGTVTRHFAQELITGQTESWKTSALHGTAVALAPDAYKLGAKYIPEGWSKITAGVFDRSANVTSATVLENVARDLGPGATPTDVAAVFDRAGLTKEAGVLKSLASKGSVTADDLAALDLDGTRGTYAITKIAASKAQAVREIAIAARLGDGGVKTVADLQPILEQEGARVSGLNAQVKALADAGKVGDSSPIRTALSKLTDGNGAKVYETTADLDKQVASLKQLGINSVKDLKAVSGDPAAFTLQGAFPKLAALPADTSLAEAARGGLVFGDADSAGRNLLENGVLKDAKLPPLAPPEPGQIKGMFRTVKNVAISPFGVRDVDLGVDVSRGTTAANTGATTAEKFSNYLKSKAPQVQFHSPSVDMPNWYGTKLSAASTDSQFAIAARQSNYWSATSGGLGAFTFYNSTTGTYDKLANNAQYLDAQGNAHPYTFLGALVASNKQTAFQAAGGGLILPGAMASAFETPVAATAIKGFIQQNWLTSLQVAGYGVEGWPDWHAGVDKMDIYNKTNEPLKDAMPDNVGTTADQVANQPAPTPDAGAPVVAPAADATPAAKVDPNADVQAAPAQPAAKPAPAPTPAPTGLLNQPPPDNG